MGVLQSVTKRYMGGGGVKKGPKKRYIIYGQPLSGGTKHYMGEGGQKRAKKCYIIYGQPLS